MAKNYVTRRIPDAGLELLRKHADVDVDPHDRPLSRDELLAAISDADGVLSSLTDRIDGELMDAAPRVKGCANYAVGYDNADVAAATQRGIPLSNTPGVLPDTALGVVGAGPIGTTMALKSRGFGMEVLSTDGYRRDVLESELGARRYEFGPPTSSTPRADR